VYLFVPNIQDGGQLPEVARNFAISRHRILSSFQNPKQPYRPIMSDNNFYR